MERMGKHEMAYLSPEAARQVLGVGRNTIYSLFHAKGFPSVHIGKRIMVRRDRLDAWLEEQGEQEKRSARS